MKACTKQLRNQINYVFLKHDLDDVQHARKTRQDEIGRKSPQAHTLYGYLTCVRSPSEILHEPFCV